MKAYQFADPAKGLELKDPPVPEPGPEQVLIAVEAAGLCRTDLHIIKGHGDAWIKEEPMTLGHKDAGVVAKPGAGVSSIRVRDKAVVAQVVQPVGQTDWSKSHWDGYGGGYAEYALAYLECPDSVSFAQAGRSHGFDRDGLSRCSGRGMRNCFYDYCCCWLRWSGNEWCHNCCAARSYGVWSRY